MEYVFSVISFRAKSLRGIFSPVFAFAAHLHDHFIPHARNNYHPHILGHRALALFSTLLIALKIFTLVVISFGPIAPAFSSAITVDNIISLTNESRQTFSLPALVRNPILDKAAQAKAEDMLAKSYFAHNSPDGKTPWDFIVSAGYSYLQAGENLAVNFTQAEDVKEAWMNSPGHKANIINKNFEEIGIGIAKGQYQGHEAIFVVQSFGTPAAQKIALKQEPTEVQLTKVPVPQESEVSNLVKDNNVGLNLNAEIRGESSIKTNKLAEIKNEPIKINSGNVTINNGYVEIQAKVSGPVVKALAYFGGQAVMLEAKQENIWQGKVLLSELVNKNSIVRINAFDINGESATHQLADFSASTQENFNIAKTDATKFVTIFGITFSPKEIENKFLLIFIAGILTSLVMAIAIKKHIQHLSLIANSSFVIMLASLLLWIG